jgi:hypothetical protein
MDYEIAESLQKMYDLGYKHGYEMALKDREVVQLKEEIAGIEEAE